MSIFEEQDCESRRSRSEKTLKRHHVHGVVLESGASAARQVKGCSRKPRVVRSKPLFWRRYIRRACVRRDDEAPPHSTRGGPLEAPREKSDGARAFVRTSLSRLLIGTRPGKGGGSYVVEQEQNHERADEEEDSW